MISAFDYETAFAVCAIGTVVGALFGTVAACRPDHQVPAIVGNGYFGWIDKRSPLAAVDCRLYGALLGAFRHVGLGSDIPDREPGQSLCAGGGRSRHRDCDRAAFVCVLPSFSLGRASDRYGRRAVLISVAFVGALCSFGFGWSGELPSVWLLVFAAVYGFAALGDSSVLSTAMSEAVPAAFLARALAVRSILGIGIGAAAPAAFGAVLDLSVPGSGWAWAFSLMGIGGLVAAVCAGLLPSEELTGTGMRSWISADRSNRW
jgi:hypothetical protein